MSEIVYVCEVILSSKRFCVCSALIHLVDIEEVMYVKIANEEKQS